MTNKTKTSMDRRTFMGTAGMLVAAPLLAAGTANA
ncbi:hypothetical protein PRI8871_03309 [Pseudoprimorskyibacter insulae]|uniref:Uncharacterized protein n=1 Tax=Pseudoprimorskyibacter insulae TaxID=1695997 RepID=A0A2R8AZL6_9RHOB|nr:hypothetical protein PRI8871_03309 [Pseudoprimorskyibacter insulae]